MLQHVLRSLALGTLCLAAGAAAQPFPAPGTGAFTWQRVGDRPISVESFSFTRSGRFVGVQDSVYTLDGFAAGASAGRWRGFGFFRRQSAAMFVVGAEPDTMLVSDSSGSVIRSTNGGRTWLDVFGPGENLFSPRYHEAYFEVPPGAPHAGRLLGGGSFIYSDDRGATWRYPTLTGFPIEPGGFVDIFPFFFRALPSGRVLVGGSWGIAASDDGGSTVRPTPLFGAYHYETYGAAAVATPGSRQSGAPACGLADAALCDGALAVGIDATTAASVKVWRTNDGGRSWSAATVLADPSDGIGYGTPAGVVSVGAGPDGLGWAVTVTQRGMIYTTRDGGQSWTAVGRLPITLDYNWATSVQVGPDGHLWVGTVNAGPDRAWLYRSAEPATAAFAVSGEVGLGEASGLGVAVRPNPAGGRVEVAVRLAEASSVRVVVMDAVGREVAVVLDGAVAAGETVRGVDVSAWPAGVYIVRATASEQMATARLVVTR